MLILNQLNQVHVVTVETKNGPQEITFTVRPALLSDLDLAYITSRADDPGLSGAGDDTKENVINLRAGRSMVLQRIVAWEGVFLSETESAPCEQKYLVAFFGQYPRVFMDLSSLVQAADEGAEKN